MPVYRIPAKVGTEMRLYTPLLCAKFQGDRIWRSRFIAVFVSVRKEEERINVLMIKTKYTLQAYRGLDTGVPCADGSVQEPWQDLH